MSLPRLHQVSLRALSLISICLVVVAIVSSWATREHAGNLSSESGNVRLSLPDQGSLTPQGSTIVVNSLLDVSANLDGKCTLREAIAAANNNTASGAAAGECAAGSSSSSDTIDLTSLTGTIDLAGALQNISSDLTIIGPGSSQLSVHRNTGGDYRIFTITSGTVAISGLTVTNGKAADGAGGPTGNSGANGGGILNGGGSLVLTDITLSGNHTGNGGVGTVNNGGSSGAGGGIANTSSLTMTNCLVTGNINGTGGSGASGGGSGGQGGGIYSTGPITLSNTTISNNQSGDGGGGPSVAFGGDGGGVYATGTNSFANVTISGNVTGKSSFAVRADGGGMRVTGGTITNSTIDGNNASNGAGISGDGTLTITGSTISNNIAGSGGRSGGGVLFGSGILKLINSTISGNDGSNIGSISESSNSPVFLINCTITNNTGGLQVSSAGSTSVRNTIIAGNGGIDVSGSFISQGHNLIGNPGVTGGPPGSGSGSFINGSNGDQVGTPASPLSPQLASLAANGGATKTHAPLSASTVLDAGDNCVTQVAHCGDANTPQLLNDQRGAGFNRLIDGPDVDSTATVDIGAYEMQTPLANLPDTSTNEDTQLSIGFDGGDTSSITSVNASSSNPALVPNDAAHLSVVMTGSTGVVTINPATNASGTTNITITINRTGGPESKTFLLTVNAVNDVPSFTKGADQTVNEDAGAQTVNGWATSISPGPADESGQTLTFQVTGNTNAALFSAGPAIGADGTLAYTPAANASGSATITINLKDNGGTANGGVDTSASQTFTITVNSVNDAPSFTKGADQTVNEDAGAQTVNNWATNLSAGPANEAGQTLSFQITNNTNAALFSAGPAVSSSGTLTYTPAANANGSATISLVIKDNGGTANGGVDTAAAQTFTITVNAVNDAPSFTKGANQTVNEDAGAQTVANWATSLSAGPANESGQTLSFQITGNSNPTLFSAGPAVSATGTLSYTPAANANGSATVTLVIKDDGGTANGGVDTSASQTFTITVNAVNDAPSFTKGGDQTVNNNAGAQTVANWATGISAGPADESGQTLTFQITGNTNSSLFTAGPAVSSTGTLTYTPSSSAGGTATITINLKDNGGTANGGVDTSPSQTFTITVTPAGGFVTFASSTGNTTENSGSTTVNVTRSGDTTRAVTVNYATNADSGVPCSTANGVASPKCDFTAALGTLSFAVGETSKSITVLISQDSFVEAPETITLTLSNPTNNAALGTPSSMAVTITDDVTEAPGNIIDDPNTFVRMHYHDFLNREGDQSGINFWTGQMTNCGSSDLLVCRVNVSGAFFLSIEFQQTGYLVERMYKTGYGDATGTSTIGGSHQIFVPVVRANEFLADTQRVGRGLVVGQPGWETVLENNKQAYALEFVQTARFISAFPTSMTPAQFVDSLNSNAGGVLSVSERQTAINLFGNSVNTTNVTARAQTLRQVAEDQDLYNAEFNRAFVLAQYIGYLRRNPNDAPESTLDYTGYDFWLSKLNQFNGDYIAAEMVKAFISSDEYRKRFGP